MQIKRQVIETRPFSRQIVPLLRSRSLLQSDYDVFKKELAEAPEKAPTLSGTGGVRKIRLKSASKGKRGGFRVCYFYYVASEAIYLLAIFQKSEQENLSEVEKTELKALTDALKGKK
jgi:mRNA-degrading endonuclease RelE of RelBE toxin-antitoxin system